VRPPYRRNVAIGIAPAITTPAIPLGGNAIASEELAGRVLSSRPGRSTAGSSRRSTILSHRPTAQQLTRAARAHSSGATDPRDATSEPPPLVDDPVDLDLDLDRDGELADRILSGLRRRGYATPIASPDADDRTSDTGLDQWVAPLDALTFAAEAANPSPV
jgi:hypothetical protein